MKTRFLLGVLLLFSITMQGQQVKVNYENITNSLPVILQEYFRMQGVQHLNLTIKGEFNGKRAKLKKYLAIMVCLQKENFYLISYILYWSIV